MLSQWGHFFTPTWTQIFFLTTLFIAITKHKLLVVIVIWKDLIRFFFSALVCLVVVSGRISSIGKTGHWSPISLSFIELVDFKFAARIFAFKLLRMVQTDLSICGCRRFTHLFCRFVRFFSQRITGLNVDHLSSSGSFSLCQTTVKVRTLRSLAPKMLCQVEIARLGSLNHSGRNSMMMI